MKQIKNRNFPISLILYSTLFLSNVSVFLTIFWLVPIVVYIQSLLLFVAAGTSVGIIFKQGLRDEFIRRLKKKWFLFPFLFFASLSLIWSEYKLVSFAHWVSLLALIVLAGAISIVKTPREILQKISIFSIGVMFISLLMVIFIPGHGIMNYYSIQGAWRGIFWHKNHMGFIAALSSLIFLASTVESFSKSRRFVVLWGTLYIFSLFFLYKTDSVGAYLSTIAFHGAYFFLLLWSKVYKYIKPIHYFIMLGVGLVIALIVFSNLDFIFGLFGRNTSLTGRIPMWEYVFTTYFSNKPLLGYGFNAFWYSPLRRVDIQMAAGYPDQIVIADNGFIDILISNGVVGFAFFLLFFFGLCYNAFKILLNKPEQSIRMLPLVLIAFSVVSNISWSFLIENESYLTFIIFVMLFGLDDFNSKKPPIKGHK